MEKVLLHSCCAPCSAAIIEWMLANGIEPVVYYFNPNIFPVQEYDKRKEELNRFCAANNVRVIDGDYDHGAWRKAVGGLETEPERGARCQVCFNLRLLSAAQKCAELGITRFTTTLASSRWKSLEQVDRAGFAAAEATDGVEYWQKNWRKGGLQDRRNQLLKINNFYNQLWCGCEFSMQHLEERIRRQAMEGNPVETVCEVCNK